MGKARPVTDEDRTAVHHLHAQKLSRNEIARRLGRSGRTISLIAQDLGLSFDRAAETEVATRVRQADNKARRAGVIARLYDIAEDDIAHLRKQGVTTWSRPAPARPSPTASSGCPRRTARPW